MTKKIILITLNIILLSIIWLSKDSWFAGIESEYQRSNIVLSKESTFEVGKDILWEIQIDEKREMGDILELEVRAPTLGKPETYQFHLQIEGYINFEDGPKLQRKFVPSQFGQNMNRMNDKGNRSGFTQDFIDPNIINSKSALVAKMGETDIYDIGRFVNVFWEPLTLEIKIIDVAPELSGKQFHMTLNGTYDNAIRGHIGQVWLFKYLLFSVAVICLLLINYLNIKKKL
jgi:hypothetical protein